MTGIGGFLRCCRPSPLGRHLPNGFHLADVRASVSYRDGWRTVIDHRVNRGTVCDWLSGRVPAAQGRYATRSSQRSHDATAQDSQRRIDQAWRCPSPPPSRTRAATCVASQRVRPTPAPPAPWALAQCRLTNASSLNFRVNFLRVFAYSVEHLLRQYCSLGVSIKRGYVQTGQ